MTQLLLSVLLLFTVAWVHGAFYHRHDPTVDVDDRPDLSRVHFGDNRLLAVKRPPGRRMSDVFREIQTWKSNGWNVRRVQQRHCAVRTCKSVAKSPTANSTWQLKRKFLKCGKNTIPLLCEYHCEAVQATCGLPVSADTPVDPPRHVVVKTCTQCKKQTAYNSHQCEHGRRKMFSSCFVNAPGGMPDGSETEDACICDMCAQIGNVATPNTSSVVDNVRRMAALPFTENFKEVPKKADFGSSFTSCSVLGCYRFGYHKLKASAGVWQLKPVDSLLANLTGRRLCSHHEKLFGTSCIADCITDGPTETPSLRVLDSSCGLCKTPMVFTSGRCHHQRLHYMHMSCTAFKQSRFVYVINQGRRNATAICEKCAAGIDFHLTHMTTEEHSRSIGEPKQAYGKKRKAKQQTTTVGPTDSTHPDRALSQPSIQVNDGVDASKTALATASPDITSNFRRKCAILRCALKAKAEYSLDKTFGCHRLKRTHEDRCLNECHVCETHWKEILECNPSQLPPTNNATTKVNCTRCNQLIILTRTTCTIHSHTTADNRKLVLPCCKSSQSEKFVSELDRNDSPAVFVCADDNCNVQQSAAERRAARDKLYQARKYQANPSPKKQAVKVNYKFDPKTKRFKRTMKYAASPTPEREARRDRYQADPSPEKRAARELYAADPSPKRQSQREQYEADPSPKRQSQREQYEADPSPKRQSQREQYEADPSPKRQSQREQYEADPSPKNRADRERYAGDRSLRKMRRRQQYAENPSPEKKLKRLRYFMDPSPVRRLRRNQYHDHPSPIIRRVQQYRQAELYTRSQPVVPSTRTVPVTMAESLSQTLDFAQEFCDHSSTDRFLKAKLMFSTVVDVLGELVEEVVTSTEQAARQTDLIGLLDGQMTRLRRFYNHSANFNHSASQQKQDAAGFSSDIRNNVTSDVAYVNNRRYLRHSVKTVFNVTNPSARAAMRDRLLKQRKKAKYAGYRDLAESAASAMYPTVRSKQKKSATNQTERQRLIQLANKRVQMAAQRIRVSDKTNEILDKDAELSGTIRQGVRKLIKLRDKACRKIDSLDDPSPAAMAEVLTAVYGGYALHLSRMKPFTADDAERGVYGGNNSDEQQDRTSAEKPEIEVIFPDDTSSSSSSESESDIEQGTTKDDENEQQSNSEAGPFRKKKRNMKTGPRKFSQAELQKQLTSGDKFPCNDTCQYPLSWQTRLHGYLEFLTDSLTHEDLSGMLMVFEECNFCRDSHCELGINCLNLKNMLYNLKYHYHNCRYLIGVYYKIRRANVERQELWKMVINRDTDALNIMFPPKISISQVERPSVNERDIREKYADGIKKYEEAIFSIPDTECVMCHMLHLKSDMKTLIVIEDTVTGCFDESFKCNAQSNAKLTGRPKRTTAKAAKVVKFRLSNEHNQDKRKRESSVNEVDREFWEKTVQLNELPDASKMLLCFDCAEAVKAQKVAKYSKANNMHVEPPVPGVDKMNFFELLLCRIKNPFQAVIKLPCMMKNVPDHLKVSAVKGTATYLPVPLTETLKKLVEEKAAGPNVHLVVQSLPQKFKKTIWRLLVDINKVREFIIELKNRGNKRIGDVVSEELLDSMAQNNVTNFENSAASSLPDDMTDEDLRNAMLTQTMPQNFQHYGLKDQYICKDDGKESKLYQQKRVAAQPLYPNHPNLETDSFPHLYPSGNFGKSHTRPQPMTENEFLKHKWKHCDPRYREDLQYILFESGLKEWRSIDQGSPQYWSQRRDDLRSMDAEWGPATFFLTLSAAEYRWDDMVAALRANNPARKKMSDNKVRQLTSSDPITVVEQFYRRLFAIFDFIKDPNGPFDGKVEHWFWRVEMQARGAPHVHCKLWIKDAPIVGVNSPEEITAFIEKHITCQLPSNDTSPELRRLVTTYQMHTKHSATCLRKKFGKGKGGSIKWSSFCRFGFPRKTQSRIKLRSVQKLMLNRKLRRNHGEKLYSLARSDAEAYINDYNAPLLLNWKGNMDIQYIGERTSKLNHYMTGYTTKSEKEAKDDWQSVATAMRSFKSSLKSYARHMLMKRELGVYEASIRLLGLPMYGADTHVKWLNTNPSNLRTRRILDHKELIKDSTASPYCNNMIDVYYVKRADSLKDECLYDVVRWYDYAAIKCKTRACTCCIRQKSGGGYLHKRQKPYVVKTQRHTVKPETRDLLFHQMLIMFKPYREESELCPPSCTFEEAYELYKEEIKAKAEQSTLGITAMAHLDEIDELLDKYLKRATTASQLAVADEANNQAADDLLVEQDVELQTVDEDELNARIGKMGPEQKKAFERITSHLKRQNQTDDQPIATDLEPLNLFVSGVAGTGKSFLIDCVRDWMANRFGTDSVIVGAPTGMAAFNVKGTTIHKLFRLLPKTDAVAAYNHLPETTLKEMREKFRKVKLCICDEVSMISNVMLAMMDQRASTYTRKMDKPFGGLNVLFLGDLLQLPPVGIPKICGYIFEEMTAEQAAKAFGSALVLPSGLWDNFEYMELQTNQRQAEDKAWGYCLNRVRLGIETEDDVKLLKSRLMVPLTEEEEDMSPIELAVIRYQECRRYEPSAVSLFPRIADAQKFNELMLIADKIKISEIHAIDTGTITAHTVKTKRKLNSQKAKRRAEEAAGMESVLRIGPGARVMLRRNVQVEEGLVNGSLGTVTKMVKDDSKIVGIEIDFDVRRSKGLEPMVITKHKSDFEVKRGQFATRTQFPLLLAFGMTIHKAQGQSVNVACIDAGNSVFETAQSYVALSRVRTIKGLHLIGLDPDRILCNERVRSKRKSKKAPVRAGVGVVQEESPDAQSTSLRTARTGKETRKLFAEDQASSSGSASTKKFITFRNARNECFAIASVQMLLALPDSLDTLLQNATQDFEEPLVHALSFWRTAERTEQASVRTITAFRTQVADAQQPGTFNATTDFKDDRQWDASGFLMRLIGCCINPCLNESFSMQVYVKYSCSCGNQTTTSEPVVSTYFAPLPITVSRDASLTRKSTVNNKITAFGDPIVTMANCTQCNTVTDQRREDSFLVMDSTKYMIVCVSPFITKNIHGLHTVIRQKVAVGSFDVNNISMKNQGDNNGYTRWRVQGVVMHRGVSLDSGHYWAWRRHNQSADSRAFTRLDDSTIGETRDIINFADLSPGASKRGTTPDVPYAIALSRC